jgi:hypothetical protein
MVLFLFQTGRSSAPTAHRFSLRGAAWREDNQHGWFSIWHINQQWLWACEYLLGVDLLIFS